MRRVFVFLLASMLSSLAWAAPPTYHEALAAGRKATKDKRWSAAFKALDQAIAARPHDGRALAARGYARLLSLPETGPVDKAAEAALLTAEEDLTLAIASEHSEAVTKAATYNLTLLAKKRAAWGGKSGQCLATFKSGQVSTLYPSWKALLDEVVTDYNLSLDGPNGTILDSKSLTEAAAKAVLCEGACTGSAVSELIDDGRKVLLAVTPRPSGGAFAVILADGSHEWDCYRA